MQILSTLSLSHLTSKFRAVTMFAFAADLRN